jgi:DNA mismatch repair protein MutH
LADPGIWICGNLSYQISNAHPILAKLKFITQISRHIDDYVGFPRVPFAQSQLYQKIRNLVYLPVVKDAQNVADWYFTDCVHVQIPIKSRLFTKLEYDYNLICDGMIEHIEGYTGNLHTTNGKYYIQIRTKDSTPYHPIYSHTYRRNISNKNFAFYFLKRFMRDAIDGNLT